MENDKSQGSDEQLKTKTEKKKRRKWPWIILAIVIILPLVFLGWSGIWNIPVLTNLFGMNKPIDLGVEISAEALASAEADNPMTMDGEPGDFCGVCERTYEGEVEVDDQHTSEEVTSWIDHYARNAPHARDLQVKFREGGMEISLFLIPFINAPVYIDVDVSKSSAKSVDLDLKKAKVGRLPVPSRYFGRIEEAAEEVIADQMMDVESFSLETLEYHDGYAYFKGTLPETVTPTGTQKDLSEIREISE